MNISSNSLASKPSTALSRVRICLKLEVARRKGSMRNLYLIGSRDDHSQLPQKEYDLLFANGVFFVSQSHPDLSCISKLCNLVKNGGYIIISTSETYIKNLSMEPVEELERQGKLKILPKLLFRRVQEIHCRRSGRIW